MLTFSFDRARTQNFEEATKLEWLETNGLGGWASSTIVGAHTRRYHGLLVAATEPPVGRKVLLSKLDESIVIDSRRYELGCNRYPGAIHPQGHRFLHRFHKELFPSFEYHVGGVRFHKTIAALHGENTTLILYSFDRTDSPFRFELQPFVAMRDYHSLTRANDAIQQQADFTGGKLRLRPYESEPEIFVSLPNSTFEAQPDWYYNFHYRKEQERGLDFQEDLFSYGRLRIELKGGETLGVIISTGDPAGRDARELFEREKERRHALIQNPSAPDEINELLTLAADQFIVARGKELRTIIAGYHWFADWGRDTMIALPGLCLTTGRFDDAKKILRAFAGRIDRGMLPNRFPDRGETPEYNTVDATLWFFVAIYKYLQFTGDKEFITEELLPQLRDIIAWHDRGTRYNIRTDGDGLLYAGEDGVQLTWMDAKAGDWVVTPRRGKAVEINALWYNALMIYAELCQLAGNEDEAEEFSTRASQVKQVFNQMFWNDRDGYLYDVIDGEQRDSALRPNQIFALSLPFPLLSGERARRVLQIVSDRLYTPRGLRSLAPGSEGYRSTYRGDQRKRDAAYHQGIVWCWLLGPYMDAIVRVEGKAGKKRVHEIIAALEPHLSEAGIGTLSEIFDAEAPHDPRGCIAQAWSVAEILRACSENV